MIISRFANCLPPDVPPSSGSRAYKYEMCKIYLKTPKIHAKWNRKLQKYMQNGIMNSKFNRIISYPKDKSFFLFGPRGVGKTTWLLSNFPNAVYLDFLEAKIFNELFADPQRLENFIPKNFDDWIILDEIQRVPEVLNEVHRLIENKKIKFILTGSSARKLKRKDVNLLAGRALTCSMHPFSTLELKKNFDLERCLKWGFLPSVFFEAEPKKYLESYVMTYLNQEVLQEGLTRNLSAFGRFLEAASFSQGSVLNISEVARECAVQRKVVENYFSILEDMMIAYKLPVFAKKAKRKLISHTKFYIFDVGIYRTLRPKGPLDAPEEIDGIALETLIFQELKAINDYLDLGYKLYYWRTSAGVEVDFVLYGEKGIIAIEVKRTGKINSNHLKGLKAFLKDYPNAEAYMLYMGDIKLREGEIEILPVKNFLENIISLLDFKHR